MAGYQQNGDYIMPNGTVIPNPQNAQAKAAKAQADAAANIAQPASLAGLTTLQNQAKTTAPGYMSAADQAAADLNRSTLAETTRANQATEAGRGAALGETTREAQSAEGLAQSKFDATKAMREKLIGQLGDVFGGSPGSAPGAAPGEAPVAIGVQSPGEATIQTGGPNTPGPGGGAMLPSPSDPYGLDAPTRAAEDAALTGAKERTGDRLASSLRSLHEMSAARGINGSGIEAANMRGLYGDALSGTNDTERGIIQSRATRAAGIANAQWQRGNDVQDRNFAAQQALLHDKISALLGTFGLSY